jgi:hypothetical protein
MDDLYQDSTFDENDDSYEHHDIHLLTGKLRCFRKAKATCNSILHLIQRHKYRSLLLLLSISRRRYRHLFERFPNNTIYKGMFELIETLLVLYNNDDVDGMKTKIKWRIKRINMRMGNINPQVNGYVGGHVGTNITNTTKNATSNETNIKNNRSTSRRGPFL